jgi:hypothetical protein
LIERKSGMVCYQIGDNLSIDNITFSQKTTENQILSPEKLFDKIISFKKQITFIGKDSVFTGKGLSLYWFDELEK